MSSQGRESARVLATLTRGDPPGNSMQLLRESRVRERGLAAEIETLLCASGQVPFGRDDVEPLARAVQAVPRSIRKFGERYNISTRHVEPMRFAEHAAMLETATDALHCLVLGLRDGSRIPDAKRCNDTLQRIEGEVDQTVVDSIVQLYAETENPVRAVVLKDLYELLDRTFDRCRSAGNLILRIAMKHS